MKLLCRWFGEELFEETAPREKLIEIIKHLNNQIESDRKLHKEDMPALKDLTSF